MKHFFSNLRMQQLPIGASLSEKSVYIYGCNYLELYWIVRDALFIA